MIHHCIDITSDIGRGILLYAHKSLKAKEVEMQTYFQDSLFPEMKPNNTDKLLVGCIYRSESGSDDNTTKLRSLTREAVTKRYSYVLLMGNFNYPDIDWSNCTTKCECTVMSLNLQNESEAASCFKTSQIQHVSEEVTHQMCWI